MRQTKADKVIIVTGAGSGLGQSVANKLISMGYLVYGTYHTRKPVEPKFIPIKLDITNFSHCEKVINLIIKKHHHVDVLINCAALTLTGPTLSFSYIDFENSLRTNILGPFSLIKISRPRLVINVTSLNGFLSLPNFGVYSASKHGLQALGMALRYELYGSTQMVNVAPGAFAGMSPLSTKRPLSHTPARKKFPILNFLLPITSHEAVVNKICSLVGTKHVPSQVLIGPDAHITYWVQKLLPQSIFDKLMLLIWSKK